MAVVARHSDKKARIKLAYLGNTVIIIGYFNHHEKDEYKLLNIYTKKPIFSIDVIRINKTNSQHMGKTQVDFTASEEEEIVDI
jgi:hypothetical protein